MDHNVFRSLTKASPPTSIFIASLAATDATTFTAVFKMPEVSQVSTIPRGESGKMQARHAVFPGKIFSVTP
jgi:hypothetical protein